MTVHRHYAGRFATIAIALALFLTFGSSWAYASGETYFHSQQATPNTILAGEQASSDVLLKIPSAGVEVTCPEVALSGTLNGHAKGSVDLHPTYDQEKTTCEDNVFGNAQVKSKGCDYNFSAYGHFEFGCEAGHQIEIVSFGCTLKLGSPGPFGNNEVSYQNNETGEASGRSLGIAVNIEEVAITTSGGLCVLGGIPKKGAEGIFEGNFTLKGYRDEGGKAGAQQGLWVGPPDSILFAEGRFLEGAQADYSVFSLPGAIQTVCQEASLNGQLTQAISEKETEEGGTLYQTEAALLHPEYNHEANCSSGTGKTSIKTVGCFYNLVATGPHPGLEIECEAGRKIEFNVFDTAKCTISVPSQMIEGAVTYANENPSELSKRLKLVFSAEGLHYTTSGTGSSCGSDGLKKEGNDLRLNSKYTLNAYRDVVHTEQTNLWVE